MLALRPTFSESWYRVANLKAKLRASAQISRQFYRGERWYVVRDPAGNQFHRLSAPAYRFVGLLDGTRTVAEAWDLVGGHLADDAPTQDEVIQILSQLHAANLLESDVTPDAQVLLRRHKKMQTRQWQQRAMNLLFPRIPIWDCDRFLVRWMPVVRPFLSPLGVGLWLAMVISAGLYLTPRWSELVVAAQNAISPNNWIYLWGSFVLIKFVHELGHAFACRRFGGEVHEMGIMFLVFVPTPYVDASTAWAFPSRWARMFVGAGGMIIELFVASIFAFIWGNTKPDSLVNQLSYNIMLIASVSTLLFNANPLLRYDGYYMLSDWLEIPNLANKSREYLHGLFKRHLFRVKDRQPLPPWGQRVWLFLYAVAAGIYRVFIGVMIILLVSTKVPILGILMALAAVATWLVLPVIKVAKYLLLDAELHRKRTRAIAWTLGIVALVVALVGMIRFDANFDAVGVVEPGEKQAIRIETEGIVADVSAFDGQKVKAGDVILTLRNPILEAQVAQLEAQLRGLTAKRDLAIKDSQSHRLMFEEQMKAVQEQLNTLRERRDKLTVKAEMDGLLIAPRLRDLPGSYLKKGSQVAMVASLDRLVVYAMLDQNDAHMIYQRRLEQPDATTARVRLVSRKGDELTGDIDNRVPVIVNRLRSRALSYDGGGDVPTDPSDKEGLKLQMPMVEVPIGLDNAGRDFLPGQRAYVRFDIGKRPLIENWTRRFWQLLQRHSQSKWV